jgi:hypothetical protein
VLSRGRVLSFAGYVKKTKLVINGKSIKILAETMTLLFATKN